MTSSRFSVAFSRSGAIRPPGRATTTTAMVAKMRVMAAAAAARSVPQQYKIVEPVGERVFVKVDAADITTAGGIVLPSSIQKAPTKGNVVATGKDCGLKVGENVIYGQYSGTQLSLGGEEHVLLKEDDIVGVMKSKNVAQLQPLGDRILVEVAEVEDQTAGGVLLANSATEKPTVGKVLAVGPGKKDDDGEPTKPSVNVGSTILYSKYSGTEFEGEDGMQYIVIRANDVLAELS